MVPLLGLWCPRPQGEGHDPCDPLGSAPGRLRKFWQDLAWSAEPDRGGKGSVKECRANLGRPWQIMTGPGMDWRCTGQGKAGLGKTWLGREGLVLVYQQNRGSQDRHRPVLRIGVLLVYVVYLDIKCLSLPYPVLPGFARSCPNLPRPIRTQFALSWPSPILTQALCCPIPPFPPPLSSSADHARSC